MQDRLLAYTIHKQIRTHSRYNARNNGSDHLKVLSCSVFQPMLWKKVTGEHKNKAFNLILHVRFHFESKKLLTPFVGTTHFYWHSATLYHLHLRGSTISRFSQNNRLIEGIFMSKSSISLPKFHRWPPPYLIPLLSPLLNDEEVYRTSPFNYRAREHCRPFIDL